MALLDRLKRALGESGRDQADPEQARRIAAAVLLLEMAGADFDDHAAEDDEIHAQLQSQFSLNREEVAELVEAARSRSQESVSLHPYLKALNAGMGLDDKRRVLEMLWRVAYADRRLDPREEALMRELADLLYLPHREFIRAKLTVVEGHQAGS